MDQLERKTVYVSPQNREEAEVKVETHKVFGWVVESREHDSKRNVDRVELVRDLSTEENQYYKAMQEDYDDCERAKLYCDLNVEACEQKIKQYRKGNVVSIGMIFTALLAVAMIVLAFVVKFSDVLVEGGYITFTLNGEDIEMTKDFVYELPESGDALSNLFRGMGITEISYDFIMTVAMVFILAIAAFLLIIFTILVVNAVFKKRIMREQRLYEEKRKQQFEQLRKGLDEWEPGEIIEGTYDAYRYYEE